MKINYDEVDPHISTTPVGKKRGVGASGRPPVSGGSKKTPVHRCRKGCKCLREKGTPGTGSTGSTATPKFENLIGLPPGSGSTLIGGLSPVPGTIGGIENSMMLNGLSFTPNEYLFATNFLPSESPPPDWCNIDSPYSPFFFSPRSRFERI